MKLYYTITDCIERLRQEMWWAWENKNDARRMEMLSLSYLDNKQDWQSISHWGIFYA